MTGKQLYEKYWQEAEKEGPDSAAWEYANTLDTAYCVVGEVLYQALEKAEKEGKKISVTYPIPIDQGMSEPDGIEFI